jgi:RHS repeat-associated protein
MTDSKIICAAAGDSLSRGKGGISGLLARSSGYSSGTGNWSTHNYYFADGNGNITYLESSCQALTASYRYDPFGNTISSTGGPQDPNVYRFSSKEILVNSGLYYYGYRFYDPSLQRWLNRDPAYEKGGLNLHRFAENNPLQRFDPDGRDVSTPLPSPNNIECGTRACINADRNFGFVIVTCWDPNIPEKNAAAFLACKQEVKRVFDLCCECACGMASQGRIAKALERCMDQFGSGHLPVPTGPLPKGK